MAKACTRSGIHVLMCPSEEDEFPTTSAFCDTYGTWRLEYAHKIRSDREQRKALEKGQTQASSSVPAKRRRVNERNVNRNNKKSLSGIKKGSRLAATPSTSTNKQRQRLAFGST